MATGDLQYILENSSLFPLLHHVITDFSFPFLPAGGSLDQKNKQERDTF